MKLWRCLFQRYVAFDSSPCRLLLHCLSIKPEGAKFSYKLSRTYRVSLCLITRIKGSEYPPPPLYEFAGDHGITRDRSASDLCINSVAVTARYSL